LLYHTGSLVTTFILPEVDNSSGAAGVEPCFFIHLKYSKVICASKNIKEMPTLSNSWVCSLAGYGRTGESGDETPQW